MKDIKEIKITKDDLDDDNLEGRHEKGSNDNEEKNRLKDKDKDHSEEIDLELSELEEYEEDAEQDMEIPESHSNSISNAENKLMSEIKDLRAENEELSDKYKRLMAEFDNYRKRTVKERTESEKYKHEEFLREFLPILDQFKIAFGMQKEIFCEETRSFYDGFRMIYESILQLLDRYEVKMMKVIGESFDPNYHDAIAREETDEFPDNTIISEFSAGYTYKDKIIIHPKVRVAMNKK